ncbi:ADP-ribosylation factor-related protein 1 [Hordeum vulgare]|nr:ADP-ribosylation factor-related protein 1 [Hordeum vulgare]
MNEDHARYPWENSLSVPWPSIMLPEGWNLNHCRVPIPQVPTDGLERRREIRWRRSLLPLDLKLDPGFAPTSDLWDRWFIPGVAPEGRRRMYFASVGPRSYPSLPAAQGQVAALLLEVDDLPAEEQLAPLPLEVADPLAEDQEAALEQERAPPSSDSYEE